MKRIIRFIFWKLGFIIFRLPRNGNRSIKDLDGYIRDYNKENLLFESIKDSTEAYKIIKPNTMVPFDNLASLYDQIHFLERENVNGDFVECGVWKGGSVGMMALANLKYGSKRRHLHLFDSFNDICEPNPDIDGVRAMSEAEKYGNKIINKLSGSPRPMKGFYDFIGGHGTIQDCNKLLIDKIKYPNEFIHIYPGWFQETFPGNISNIKDVALLRLDSDWYESTKLCLEYFYDKVITGGIIVIDDYGAYEGCKKAVDEFFKKRSIKKYLIRVSSLNKDCFFMIK